jgi:cysteine-rich repeat protein
MEKCSVQRWKQRGLSGCAGVLVRAVTLVLSLVGMVVAPAVAHASVVPDDSPTIQAALNAAAAGDTISVKDSSGPYFEKIVFSGSGSAGAYITLQAFPGHKPVLDGTGVSGGNMVLIDSKSYVKVVGFEIRNNLNVNDGSGIRVLGSGSHIEIRDNRIHDMRGKHAMGITVYGTEAASISDLIIDGNEIYDCEPAQSEALTLNGNVEQFEVTNNLVRDVNNIGIDFIGGETGIQPDPTKVARNGVCRGNAVYRARSSYGGGYAAAIYVDGGKDIVIERNIVSESDLGIEIGAENAGIVTRGIVVRDNLVYENDKVGIVFGGYAASTGRVKDSFFLNNTCYRNDTLGEGLGELWIQYAENNVVRNNVFYATEQNVLLYSESGNVGNTLDYNLWFVDAGESSATFVWQGTAYGTFGSYRAGSGQDPNSVFAAPQFVNAAAADFHLKSGSPAVNAGDPAFVPGSGEMDIDGAPRVSGGRVDIGADEASCSDGTVDPGEQCDDSNLVDCDGCDSNCTWSTTCGNDIVCGAEQCDDGNVVDGDCCSSGCEFEALGSDCTDGNACTIDDACDGAGTCAGDAAPQTGCRGPTGAGSASFFMRDQTDNAKDSLSWKWAKGEQTLLGEFGNPLATTGFTLCVFDRAGGSPARMSSETVPAGASCGAESCWTALGDRGFRFRDASNRFDGIRSIVLKPGDAGKAKIIVKGKGENLGLPSLPLAQDSNVTVQLKRTDDDTICWGADYSAPALNEPDRFRDKSE